MRNNTTADASELSNNLALRNMWVEVAERGGDGSVSMRVRYGVEVGEVLVDAAAEARDGAEQRRGRRR